MSIIPLGTGNAVKQINKISCPGGASTVVGK